MDLKKNIEERLILNKKMKKLFPEGISIDLLKNNHISVSIKKLLTGEMYDDHECVITVKSKDKLEQLIHVRPITDALNIMQERWGFLNEAEYPHIVSVIYIDSKYSKDMRSVDIAYRITSNIERIK